MSLNEKDQISNQNLAVTANLVDLAASIVQGVAGNDISNAINGQFVSGGHLRELCAARLQLTLTQQLGGV
jgi:hypothetical protein